MIIAHKNKAIHLSFADMDRTQKQHNFYFLATYECGGYVTTGGPPKPVKVRNWSTRKISLINTGFFV